MRWLAAAFVTATIAAGQQPKVPAWPWLALAKCETNITWKWNNSQYEGAYGFTHDAWRRFRYPRYPAHAYKATPWQQTRVAIRIQKVVGWGAWPACSIRLGLR